jgi:hypothetical protein
MRHPFFVCDDLFLLEELPALRDELLYFFFHASPLKKSKLQIP